jgi:excisionase family DNA binding protein
MSEALMLNTSEAARLLGVAPKTVLRLIQAGRLPAIYIHRRYLIPRRAVEEFVEAVYSGRRCDHEANEANEAGTD